MMPRVIFDSEHEQFRETVRRFLQREIRPHAERWRKQGHVDRDAFIRTGRQGFLLMWAPQEFGGSGVDDLRFEQIFFEENVRYGEQCFYATLHSRIVAPYIGTFGTDGQKRRWLPAAAAGE